MNRNTINNDITTPWMTLHNWFQKTWLRRSLWSALFAIGFCVANLSKCLWRFLCYESKTFKAVHSFLKNKAQKYEHKISFLKALIINPRATGAVLPSSKRLAKTMAAQAEVTHNGLIVELGAGTGIVTEALLAKGIKPEQLVVIEYAPHLANKLKRKYPQLNVIEGNAANLIELLQDLDQPVNTVISGLPLRSLPEEITQSILRQIPQVLSKNGRYIQFTYDFRKSKGFYPSQYRLTDTKTVLRNIPPAKVQTFCF